MTDTSNALVVQIKEAELSPPEAASLEQAFSPFFQAATSWADKANAIVVTDANQTEKMREAREIRLQLKEIRVNAEKTRKDLKAESLRKGKAIDGVYNIINFIVAPLEEHLQKQEDFARIQQEKEAAERKEKRTAELTAVEVDPTYYDLAAMPQATYDSLLKNSTDAFNAKRAAAIKEEEERIAKAKAEEEERVRKEQERMEKEKQDAAERERLRIENERLEKEAQEREAAAKKEREEREAAIKKEREEREKKEREEQEKIRKEKEELARKHQEEVEKERKEKERLETEARVRKEAEEKERKEAEERERQMQLAPDRQKLEALSNAIATIQMPDVRSEAAKLIVTKAIALLKEASSFVKVESTKL